MPASLSRSPAVAFLAAQVGAIGWARLAPARFFAWAPYDRTSLHTVEVTLDGRVRSRTEAQLRYGFPLWGRGNRSIRRVIDGVAQFEETYGADDEARVVIRHTVNGGEEERGEWPER